MSFVWPEMLWLLLALPVLVGVYILLLRRRTRTATRYANFELVRAAIGPRQQLRRHLPPALFLLALAAAILALARPSAVVTLPSEQRTIILAMDVSLSMRATDVEPNRLAAAQAAARTFVQEQPADVRIGIVSFAGTASVVQPPTDNRSDLLAAIDRFQLATHTAIGSGILVALATIFPDVNLDLDAMLFGGGPGGARPIGNRRDRGGGAPAAKPKMPGTNPSAAIILLTDGRRTTGPDPLDAARLAAERGIRIYTVGIGTTEGGAVGFEGWSIYVRLDEDTLRAIADITRGEYFYAGTANDLRKVYQTLNAQAVLERKEQEISALFAAGAAALGVLGAMLSLLWSSRVT